MRRIRTSWNEHRSEECGVSHADAAGYGSSSSVACRHSSSQQATLYPCPASRAAPSLLCGGGHCRSRRVEHPRAAPRGPCSVLLAHLMLARCEIQVQVQLVAAAGRCRGSNAACKKFRDRPIRSVRGGLFSQSSERTRGEAPRGWVWCAHHPRPKCGAGARMVCVRVRRVRAGQVQTGRRVRDRRVRGSAAEPRRKYGAGTLALALAPPSPTTAIAAQLHCFHWYLDDTHSDRRS